MLKNFRTYQLAIQFHRYCEGARTPSYLRDQLLRASSSVVLNIAEGSGKSTQPEKRRFYSIAMGSLREAMAALELIRQLTPPTEKLADELGACLYRLCHPKPEEFKHESKDNNRDQKRKLSPETKPETDLPF